MYVVVPEWDVVWCNLLPWVPLLLTHPVPLRPTTPKPPQLLFKFPLEEDEADRVTVTSLDRERLAPGEFLNDNVIDFHFK